MSQTVRKFTIFEGSKLECRKVILLAYLKGLKQVIALYSTKMNKYVNKSVVTGITKIAKADIFSGMNHFIEFGLLDKKLAYHFGFTETEVDNLLEKNLIGRTNKEIDKYKENIKMWYNGYNICGLTIYNPWSIINYLGEREFKSYWLHSSNNQLLKNQLQIIADNAWLMLNLKTLLSGGTITVTNLRRNVEKENDSHPVWYLAFHSGYLTISDAKELPGSDTVYSLRIPNNEVKEALEIIMIESFSKSLNLPTDLCKEFLLTLLEGKIKEFYQIFSSHVMTSTSMYQIWIEGSYQNMLYGLLWFTKETHYIDPDDEAGHGRSDLILTPKPSSNYTKGIIIEIKVSKKENDDLIEYSKKALDQIIEKSYDAKLKEVDYIKEIVYIGMGLFQNKVHITYGISKKDSNSNWSPIEIFPIDYNNEKKIINSSIKKTKVNSKSKNIKSSKDFDPIKTKKEVEDSSTNDEN